MALGTSSYGQGTLNGMSASQILQSLNGLTNPNSIANLQGNGFNSSQVNALRGDPNLTTNLNNYYTASGTAQNDVNRLQNNGGTPQSLYAQEMALPSVGQSTAQNTSLMAQLQKDLARTGGRGMAPGAPQSLIQRLLGGSVQLANPRAGQGPGLGGALMKGIGLMAAISGGLGLAGLPGIPSISGMATNAGNSVGGMFGNGTLGSDISNGISNITNLAGNGSEFGSEPAMTPADNAFLSTAHASASGIPVTAADNAFLSHASSALTPNTSPTPTASSSIFDTLGKNSGLLSAAGSVAGGLLSRKTADTTSTNDAGLEPIAPFVPTQAGAMTLPSSLSDMSNLSPLQQATGLATKGTYGGGLGPQEESYFNNLENRKLVDASGNVSPLSTLTPIENTYLQKTGFGGNTNSTDLLKALSTWQPM